MFPTLIKPLSPLSFREGAGVGRIYAAPRLVEEPHPAATKRRFAPPSLAAPPLKGRGTSIQSKAEKL